MIPEIVLKGVQFAPNGRKLLDNISFTITGNEYWAISGAAGSGKTLLGKAIAGLVFHAGEITFRADKPEVSIRYVQQEHQIANRQNLTSALYYQQRFNSTEAEDSKLVSDLVDSSNPWLKPLGLDTLLSRPLIQLSNGENKRLQLAEHLSANPDILILDNPYLGLDTGGRRILDDVIIQLCKASVRVVLISSTTLPSFITHVARLHNGRLEYAGVPGLDKSDFTHMNQPSPGKVAAPPASYVSKDARIVSPHVFDDDPSNFSYAVRMEGVSVTYGDKEVLKDIHWEIRKGERWSLTGPNGSGKSTLLSLITADNPQAYSNEIFLFDKKRGSGESIWDIKKRIGFLSPELHLYFDRSATCFEVIASGLFDTIGLFRNLSDAQRAIVQNWIDVLELRHCFDSPLALMSRGEQRFAMFGRALIKGAPLLILDEPAQGLDKQQIARLTALIEDSCLQSGTTLVYVSHVPEELPGCIEHHLQLKEGRVFKS